MHNRLHMDDWSYGRPRDQLVSATQAYQKQLMFAIAHDTFNK